MGDAPKPIGMNKIMNMLANGQVPDDVKEIDDAPQAFTEPKVETPVSQARPKVFINYDVYSNDLTAMGKEKRRSKGSRNHFTHSIRNRTLYF